MITFGVAIWAFCAGHPFVGFLLLFSLMARIVIALFRAIEP